MFLDQEEVLVQYTHEEAPFTTLVLTAIHTFKWPQALLSHRDLFANELVACPFVLLLIAAPLPDDAYHHDQAVGVHEGGFTPFEFRIDKFIKPDEENTLNLIEWTTGGQRLDWWSLKRATAVSAVPVRS